MPRLYDMNWMQLEEYLERDDRIVLPLGATEQHAYLSVGTDTINAERMALEAAGPLGVPVAPCFPYGPTWEFIAYPGTVTMSVSTFALVVRELLDSLYQQGFKRILVFNNHGGNRVAKDVCGEWMAETPDGQALFWEWWTAPGPAAAAAAAGPAASDHGSWFETYPWTQVEGVDLPRDPKPPIPPERIGIQSTRTLRALLGDGSYGGPYEDPQTASTNWDAGVLETRQMIEEGWRTC